MKLLDLFCGAGGASMGYHQAGFDKIVGVDIKNKPDYPFEFVQADALEYAASIDLDQFDLIHASPPCQRFSTATRHADAHPDLVDPTRQLIASRPHVIENVIGAPLRKDLLLCGSMFGLNVQRHRLFELSWMIWSPPVCRHHWSTPHGRPWTVTGHLHESEQVYPHSAKPSKNDAAALIGMEWVKDWQSVVEAIPPAYTHYIGANYLTANK